MVTVSQERQAAVLIANQALQRMIRATKVQNLRLPRVIPQIAIAAEGDGDLATKLERAAGSPRNVRHFAALREAETRRKLEEATRLVKQLRPSGAKHPSMIPWMPKELTLQQIRDAFIRLNDAVCRS